MVELEGDAGRILRGRGILWQHSKRDDLFCPSSTLFWRLLKPIKTSVWSYGEIHSLERTEVLPWGARSSDGSDFIRGAVIWAKRVSAKLAGALVAIKELLFCNQSHCHLFDFWRWARRPYSESQSYQTAGTKGISGDHHIHKSSPAPPVLVLSLDFSNVQHPKVQCLRFNTRDIQPTECIWCSVRMQCISKTISCMYKAECVFLLVQCSVSSCVSWELVTMLALLCDLQPLNWFSWPWALMVQDCMETYMMEKILGKSCKNPFIHCGVSPENIVYSGKA